MVPKGPAGLELGETMGGRALGYHRAWSALGEGEKHLWSRAAEDRPAAGGVREA